LVGLQTRPTGGDIQVIFESFSRAAFALAACSAAMLGLSNARAANFSAEYVFGDSLSDRGNIAELENVLNFQMHGFFWGTFQIRQAIMTVSPMGLWRFNS
jgi:hypothetical protein